MKTHIILYYITIVTATVVGPIHSACSNKPSTSAVITGLFPIHSGNGCSRVDLRALQQVAALKVTVNALNTDGAGFTINLKVHDTCGSADGAVKAALKTLVDPEQMCPNPPFFMGFIGPDDKELLTAVHQVTHVFNATHIVPFTLDGANDFNGAVLQAASRKPQDLAQSVTMTLHQLDWTSFTLAIDGSSVSQALASSLIPLAQQDSGLCLKGTIHRITDTSSINEVLAGKAGHGIVVIVDTAETASKVLQVNKVRQAPMILVITKVGLQSWQIPPVNSTLVILQEISSDTIDGLEETVNATLYSEYITQQDQLFRDEYCRHIGNVATCLQNMREDVFQGSFDASLLPLSYSARLMSAALQIALKAKCGATGQGVCPQLAQMPAGEWRNYLRLSTALVKQPGRQGLPAKIRFQTELAAVLEIYAKGAVSSSLEKIGLMTNGKKLQVVSGSSFPAAGSNTPTRDTGCPDGAMQPVPTVWTAGAGAKTPPPPSVVEAEVDASQDLYEIVTLLCGAGLGILAFFLLMTYVVYKSFKVKNDNKSTGGGSFEQKPPSRIARWRRGSGQSSRASIRTLD